MDKKRMLWDYANPPEDELWRARRMAEFFPFIVEELTAEDQKILLRHLEAIPRPDERREFIRMVCGGKQDSITDLLFIVGRVSNPTTYQNQFGEYFRLFL